MEPEWILSLIGLVATGPHFPSGEAWEGVAILWQMSLPAFLLFSGLSTLFYRRYRKLTSWTAVTLFFFGNAVAVSLAGVALMWLLVSCFPGLIDVMLP